MNKCKDTANHFSNNLLYLAVPIAAYESFFQRDLPQASVRQYRIKLIVYDPVDEVIVKWIN
ncbi:MAG: element excision factor XisH family protein [Nostoc sp.]|uniref:element excision factor XisH family protein n=1 Tax=Nostoc sp. TaxID=1180 RepID=UPI002FFBD6A2